MPKGVKNQTAASPIPLEIKPYEDLLLQVLREILPNLRLYDDNRLRAKIGPEKVTDLTLELFGYIESGAGKDLNRNERLALAHRSFSCLSKYIQEMGLPVTLKTLTDFIPCLQEAVNRCFPGYHSSGLLRYLILPRA